MHPPKMILFDYGDTLCIEAPFNGAAGTKAVLQSYVMNPADVSIDDVQSLARELDTDLGRGSASYQIEVHNHIFQRYLYEYLGLELLVSLKQLEQVFWDHAAPATPTPHIERFLDYIHSKGIRSGVISNISFSGESLKERIDNLLPDNRFEFILASSDYAFRKPHRRIFEMALKKAGLPPEEVWYCGDHPAWDIEGASKAGMTAVWYKCNQTSPSYTPDCAYIKTADWLELVPMLDALIG